MWYKYEPPKINSINELSRRLERAEVFPGESPRTQKLLARMKACSLISMCPETVDLIFDVLDRYYVDTKFHQSQLDDLKAVRYDIYLAVDKYIKQGKIGINGYESTREPREHLRSKNVNVPGKRTRSRSK